MTKKTYFTFGVGDPVNAHKYVVIEGDYEEARAKMFECFGNKWSCDYDEAHWNYRKGTPEWDRCVRLKYIDPDDPREIVSQADIWNLTELKIN